MKRTSTLILTLALTAGGSLIASAQQERVGQPVTPPVVERPIAPERPTLPAELQEMIADHRAMQEALREAREAFNLSLEGLSPEAVRAAVAAFRAEHAEEIAAVQALAAQIREAMEEFRAANPRPERPIRELPPELAALREQIVAKRDEMIAARDALREQLRNATLEERRQLHEEFRASQALLQNEIRELRRQMREEAAAIRDANRRPDDGE